MHRPWWRGALPGAIGVLAAAAGAAMAASVSSSPVAALNRLPASDFPAIVSRGPADEVGTLTFQMSFSGSAITLTASASDVSLGRVGTLSRNSSDFVLRFTRVRDRVAPIKLPDGLTITSQTIALDSTPPSTLHIDRRTGAVTSNLHWVVDAPNTLYNGSHTIKLPDKGQRRFVSSTQIGPGHYRFHVISKWHGSVVLMSWSVAGHTLPGGRVTLAATWSSYYDLSVKQ